MPESKGMIKINTIMTRAASLLALLVAQSGFAITPEQLPGSVQPGVVSKQLRENQPSEMTKSLPPLSPQQEKSTHSLGEEASKIKFKLNKIILEDNKVYTEAQLRTIYQDKLNTQITVAQLQDIVQNITNYYRNNGYILTRAVLPPQHVKEGVVRIRVVEGYFANVNIVGKPKGARYILTAYGNRIAASKPLQLKQMEYYLFLANEIPGAQTKAVLEPSKNQAGASDLNLVIDQRTLEGYLSYDNYGTRYIGPQQITASVNANSVFRSGDTTRFSYVGTPKGNELQYKDVSYDTPLGTKGLRLVLDTNQAITNPLYVLQPVQVAGNAKDLNGAIRYPVIRERSQNFTIEGGFNYLDSYVTQLDLPLYTDHIRSIHLGGSYDFADRFRGANLIGVILTQGLRLLGGTTDNQSTMTSRYGATTIYTKIGAQASRLQQLFWKFSLFGLVKGQYSFNPLLASEQFGYGGSQLGRGYDPAEIIGDRGLAGSLELRLDTAPQRFLINSVQYYVYYDAGKIWNLRNVQQGVSTSQSATSTGFGARILMTKYVSGNFMYTQPLSRKVQALQQVSNMGSHPRIFFSISLTG